MIKIRMPPLQEAFQYAKITLFYTAKLSPHPQLLLALGLLK